MISSNKIRFDQLSSIGEGIVWGCHRHAKRLNFDTSGFLEDPKLTRKQRDSRQKNYSDKPKNHKILYFWSTNK